MPPETTPDFIDLSTAKKQKEADFKLLMGIIAAFCGQKTTSQCLQCLNFDPKENRLTLIVLDQPSKKDAPFTVHFVHQAEEAPALHIESPLKQKLLAGESLSEEEKKQLSAQLVSAYFTFLLGLAQQVTISDLNPIPLFIPPQNPQKELQNLQTEALQKALARFCKEKPEKKDLFYIGAGSHVSHTAQIPSAPPSATGSVPTTSKMIPITADGSCGYSCLAVHLALVLQHYDIAALDTKTQIGLLRFCLRFNELRPELAVADIAELQTLLKNYQTRQEIEALLGPVFRYMVELNQAINGGASTDALIKLEHLEGDATIAEQTRSQAQKTTREKINTANVAHYAWENELQVLAQHIGFTVIIHKDGTARTPPNRTLNLPTDICIHHHGSTSSGHFELSIPHLTQVPSTQVAQLQTTAPSPKPKPLFSDSRADISEADTINHQIREEIQKLEVSLPKEKPPVQFRLDDPEAPKQNTSSDATPQTTGPAKTDTPPPKP